MKDDQRTALTKRLLQEGLFRLLEKKDLSAIRVSELCAESGINRATFYRHYGQPRDILGDVRMGIIRDVQALAEKNHAPDNLHQWLEDISRYFLEHAALLRVLFCTRTDEDFVQAIQIIYKEQFDQIRSSVAGPRDDDSLKLCTYFCAGGFYYLLRQWILEPINKTPEEIADILYRFLTGA